MKLQFRTVRGRLAFWLLMVAVLPLLVAMTITYRQRVSVIRQRSMEKLTAIRDLKVQELKRPWYSG